MAFHCLYSVFWRINTRSRLVIYTCSPSVIELVCGVSPRFVLSFFLMNVHCPCTGTLQCHSVTVCSLCVWVCYWARSWPSVHLLLPVLKPSQLRVYLVGQSLTPGSSLGEAFLSLGLSSSRWSRRQNTTHHCDFDWAYVESVSVWAELTFLR